MKILIVVVRYNVPLSESQTISGLAQAFQNHPRLTDEMGVLIWDNSPEALTAPLLPFPIEYRHSSKNQGVSGAYNGAIPVASERNIPWMLLLDQDTSITGQYLLAMLENAVSLAPQVEIAAIVPTVRVGDFVVSPREARFNSHRAYTAGAGIATGEPFAINSGSVMRVEALRKIGGFSTEFWLDYSDMYVYHQFFLLGMKVWRASEVELQHEMTIMDYDKLMAPWRYRNFLEAEGAFHDLYKGPLENATQSLRLMVRAILQRMRHKNPEFSRTTWSYFLQRLSMRKKTRLQRWHASEGRYALKK